MRLKCCVDQKDKQFDYTNIIIKVKWSMERTKYIDKRKWPEYNEKLVRRGELYFSFEFLDSWSNDLALKK